MAIAMHPNTLDELTLEMAHRFDQTGLFFNASTSTTVSGAIPSIFGEKVITSKLIPEWEDNIKPLSDKLNIGSELRSKVNNTLKGFGRHRVVFRIYEPTDILTIDKLDFIKDSLKSDNELKWKVFY